MRKLIQPIRFDWDEGNLYKNQIKHDVSKREAEEVFSSEPIIILDDEYNSAVETRYNALGKTSGNRKLFIVFTDRGDKVRIISARDMSRKERATYEEAEKDANT